VKFERGAIEGEVVRNLTKHVDERGWLCELFRQDEIPAEIYPVMAYASLTLPGVARGPHAHERQWDYFCFLGPSNFKVYLWDNRPGSPTYGRMMVLYAGEDAPRAVAVPPGVVHAYRNIGPRPGLVFNAPNRLYGGWGRSEPVDEVRWEDRPDSPFKVD